MTSAALYTKDKATNVGLLATAFEPGIKKIVFDKPLQAFHGIPYRQPDRRRFPHRMQAQGRRQPGVSGVCVKRRVVWLLGHCATVHSCPRLRCSLTTTAAYTSDIGRILYVIDMNMYYIVQRWAIDRHDG